MSTVTLTGSLNLLRSSGTSCENMDFITKANIKGKIVLLREDLNSDVNKGKVLMSERIKQSSESVKFLKKKSAKVVIIAHQGRPGGEDFTSMEQHAKLLSKFTKVNFIPDIIGEKAEIAIKNLKDGEAILLDNVRNLKDEFSEEDTDFVKKLSSWCNVYVNDAFSVSHRSQASIVGFPKHMKSYAGPLLEKEVKALQKISLKNCLYILAGAKPADDINLLKKNKVLACGLFGQMCISATGKKLGAQDEYLKKTISDYDKSLTDLKSRLGEVGSLVKTPVDFGVKDEKGKRKDVALEDFPVNYEIFDIGPKTQKIYLDEIKKAKSIYMKGPAGYYLDPQFIQGTKALLTAVAKSKAFSLLGGGQLNEAIDRSKIPKKKFGYISLSGGALLDYVAGKRLPGLEVLGYYKD